MNIGFDASRAFVKEATGTENYSRQLLEAMLSIDTENRYFIYSKKIREKELERFSQKITWVKIGNKRLWTQVGLAAKTFTDPIDVLFVPAHTLPLIRRNDLPTVMTIHDLGAEYLPASHQLKQQLYLKFITKYQLKTASHLIAVSEATKQDLIKKAGVRSEDVSVVYEGVNFKNKISVNISKSTDILDKYDLQKRQYFLFVGTIQPRKNLVRLIEAFSLFLIENKKDTDYRLVIAGKPGWDYDDILKAPEQLGIKKKVIFTGRIDDEELASLYQNATALVYPSLFEGFGLPILEAYFFNCPVITSTISSMPEIAGKGAILVNPYQVDAIMKAMLTLSTNVDLWTGLVKKGEEQLKKFSWDKAARETMEIIEGVARKAKK